MRHVIFGGNGFVGRHLAELLLARHEEVVICDIHKSDLPLYRHAQFVELDITDRAAFERLALGPDDMVYNMAARMLVPILPRWRRRDYFWSVNYYGTKNILDYMRARDCWRMVHFTTDMVYGHMKTPLVDESHPQEPLGPYGGSKKASEELCAAYRSQGFHISIFRPRLIIGPGRLGILKKLFRLIDLNLPVPLIGDGRNRYQFISVFDCASAALCAFDKGVPNREYNLGSRNPPMVKDLLTALIEAAGKRSRLVRTPAGFTKLALNALDAVGMPLMDPEQYLIADEDCILDVSQAERDLGWQPRYHDQEMLWEAYREYRDGGLNAGAAVP